MNWIYTLTNFLIGSCLASHAAVICDRWETSDFIFSRSHCNNCYTELNLLDELPIISYFWLHGKCRYCHNLIPTKLPIIEIIGGLAFSSLNFSSIEDLFTAIIIFSILLAAICDYEQHEFYLIMLLPAIILALTKSPDLLHFQLLDDLEFLPLLLILTYYVYRQKLGSGDLLIYLILALYFSPHFANTVFLLGAIFSLGYFVNQGKKRLASKPIAFVPCLFLGLTIQLLFK
ncbi:prepilin peptidase [Lactobacillus sp. ESL0785]|uniref:prepilin peptidase n=1 Tax=Lactobacillus sp. ESL0785 TaxID=2983232 RepID=UPI0023F83564|nr:A24 family peptidase [Lactobacillus sp. ESL0785]WEV70589.1 prepilin peptidase [Lactobacillus sp. ESL0785]